MATGEGVWRHAPAPPQPRPQPRPQPGQVAERSRGGAARGPHVCGAACVRSCLWEVRAEGVWSCWCRNLWAPVSGWPGVSGCEEQGVAGLHGAGENSGSRGGGAFQLGGG